MKIEIVEFYPLERNEEKKFLNGTLKVKLVDLGIVLLGIFVSKKKENWFFSLPTRGDGINSKNPENGKSIRYPVFVFEDQEKQRAFLEAIRVKGRIFIEHRLSDAEKPLIFPRKQQQLTKPADTPKMRDKAVESKETASIEKSKSIQSIASKEWRDLPPRSVKPTQRYLSKLGRR